MMRFAICDDEPFMVDEIFSQLSSYMEEKQRTAYCVDRFFGGQALLESGSRYDLIFLDIQMDAPDGMETAKRLRLKQDRSLLVFVTVLKECVFDAFEVQAWDYLLKPLDSGHFKRTMDRAVKALEQRTDKTLILRKGNTCEVIQMAQILYCEVQGRKVYIHKRDQTVNSYYDKLEALEQRLDGRFFKCHRSYLVNLDYVRGCDGGQVILPRKERIPLSRLRERELMQALLCHMKGRSS